jgi:putative hemolysin
MIELGVIFLLFVLNGIFAMSELAILSARAVRLEQLADEGQRGAKAALALARDPNRFLSTVQIGITLISVLVGVFSGAALSDDLATQLARNDFLQPYSDALAVIIIVVVSTYFSLVIGELVPKRLALQYREAIACAVAAPMGWLAWLTAPFVALLSASTEALLMLLGITEPPNTDITEDEVMAMVRQGTETGVFDEAEHEMVEGVLSLDDQRAATLMTPRRELVWLDLQDDDATLRRKIAENPFSVYPVCQGELDQVVGVLRVRDWLPYALQGNPVPLKDILQTPLYIPETLYAMRVLELFKSHKTRAALVVNEHGGIEGIVTMTDVVEEIVDIDDEDPDAVQREDGSWLLDGLLTLDELEDIFPDFEIPDDEKGIYNTLGGFVMTRLGHVPSAAEHFEWAELRFEVMDMDGNRVDKVLAQRKHKATNDSNEKPRS